MSWHENLSTMSWHSSTKNSQQYPAVSLSKAVAEKLPLYLLTLASCIVTAIAQKAEGAIPSLGTLPMGRRLSHVPMAYIRYVGKAIWPTNLAVLYPYARNGLPAEYFILSLILISTATFAVIRLARRHPYLPVGWFWFLGMLVPVIGLVQVGGQAMADRYAYLPLIGLSIAVSWGVPGLMPKLAVRRKLLGSAACAILLILAVTSYVQAGYWRGTKLLFEHTLAVTKDNSFIHNNFGVYLIKEEKQLDEAIAHFREAVRIDPSNAEAFSNLGHAFRLQGKSDDAFFCYNEALRLIPNDPASLDGIGHLYADIKQYDKALPYLEQAVAADPTYAGARNRLGMTLTALGRSDEALPHFREAIRLDPSYVEAFDNLGVALMSLGRSHEAVAVFRMALRQRPNNVVILKHLQSALKNGSR